MGDAACAPFRRYKYNLSSCWWTFVGHTFPLPTIFFLCIELKRSSKKCYKITLLGTLDPSQWFTAILLLSSVWLNKMSTIDILTKYFVYWHLHMPRLERTSAWREPSGLLFFRSGCKVLQEHGRCTGQRSANIGATQGIAMTFRKWHYYKL